ncbi:RNA polymerase sigma factor [[Clostridium] fimetarium]|uniref:RNA polymerase sigma-70 factor, ECF subfamily n=1 Tax=[Clostridium] fimetarium TaxID=99656 RepID=A0A1I0QZ13_9FIRM|nr:sigma-70 family RNA polymerase sigma factor [[Clostridium] fimetarium]SEW32887.1 RNA polymerase sigma-70 factor, ECF subfamily [[Clostridium] fimetarium]
MITIKKSNLKKMEQLYELYESKMYSVAYGILKNVAQAEDVVQDSFMKLTDYLDKIKTVDDSKTKWLAITIVKTTAINVYRKNQRESWLFEYIEEQEMEDPHNVIETKIINMHNHDMLESVMLDMPEIYKQVIKLRYFYELSTIEISALTGVDNRTIRKRIERAKKFIIDRIGGSENEEKAEQYAMLRQKNIYR